MNMQTERVGLAMVTDNSFEKNESFNPPATDMSESLNHDLFENDEPNKVYIISTYGPEDSLCNDMKSSLEN